MKKYTPSPRSDIQKSLSSPTRRSFLNCALVRTQPKEDCDVEHDYSASSSRARGLNIIRKPVRSHITRGWDMCGIRGVEIPMAAHIPRRYKVILRTYLIQENSRGNSVCLVEEQRANSATQLEKLNRAKQGNSRQARSTKGFSLHLLEAICIPKGCK